MGSHSKQCDDNHLDGHLHQRRGHLCQHHGNQVRHATQRLQRESGTFRLPKTTCPPAQLTSLTLTIPKWIYCYLPMLTLPLVLFIGAWVSTIMWNRVDNLVIQRTESDGWELVDLFGNFDTNGDFYLSFDEALPLIQLMSQFKEVLQDDPKSQQKITPGEHFLDVEAHFSPLNISTMTKDWAHDINNNYSFHGLFKWDSPHILHKSFPVSTFLDFLPNSINSIPEPGFVYRIVSPPGNVYNAIPAGGRSTRHFPPQPSGKGQSIHSLLSMFHPRPFVMMRFPPQGAMGCIRAVSKTHVHIVFRVHAEFQLNEPPRDPFWFSPAQFSGSLILSRNGSSVEYFHLHVPAERNLNVDMEWLTEDNPEGMEVDIGYMPLMELVGQGRSRPSLMPEKAVSRDEVELKEGLEFQHVTTRNFKWDRQITEEAARDLLELEFFPFKRVKYYNLSEAFTHAHAEDKLVHSILLWGALDDQSC